MIINRGRLRFSKISSQRISNRGRQRDSNRECQRDGDRALNESVSEDVNEIVTCADLLIGVNKPIHLNHQTIILKSAGRDSVSVIGTGQSRK